MGITLGTSSDATTSTTDGVERPIQV